MGSTKMRPNEVGRFEHPRQIEMFTAEEDGRIEDDFILNGDGSDPRRDHGTQGIQQTQKGNKDRVQVYEHQLLVCSFCRGTDLQFVHGHYHCTRCGMANFNCCDGEVACE